jgi:hypothetical protein
VPGDDGEDGREALLAHPDHMRKTRRRGSG